MSLPTRISPPAIERHCAWSGLLVDEPKADDDRAASAGDAVAVARHFSHRGIHVPARPTSPARSSATAPAAALARDEAEVLRAAPTQSIME